MQSVLNLACPESTFGLYEEVDELLDRQIVLSNGFKNLANTLITGSKLQISSCLHPEMLESLCTIGVPYWILHNHVVHRIPIVQEYLYRIVTAPFAAVVVVARESLILHHLHLRT